MGDPIKVTGTSHVITPASVETFVQGAGNLQGRRVINTTEKIEALKQQFAKDAISSRFNYYEGTGALMGVGALLFLEGLFLVLDANTSYKFNQGQVVTIAGGLAMFIGNGLSRQLNQKFNGLNDEDFIGWAEGNNIELTSKNIAANYQTYNTVKQSVQNITNLISQRQLPATGSIPA